ncbi:MAG: tetratricopeptide repeat protein [Candidatus Neomarinimicrobiota bacterium]
MRDLVEIDTDHVGAYIRLGDILRARERPDQAAKIHQSLTFRRRLTTAQKVEIFSSLAKDYYSSGNYSRAEENANRVVQLDRKNRWAAEYLIQICEEQERWLDATEYLKRFEKLSGGNGLRRRAFHRMMEGRSREKDSRSDDARAEYRKATKIDAAYADPYLYLGNLDEQEGNLEAAVENWKEFARLSPSSGKQVLNRLEKALFELGRFGEVEDFYRKLLEKNLRDKEVLSALVNVLQAKGEYDEALDVIEDALSRDDSSILARLARLQMMLKKNDQQELSDEVEKIVRLLHGNAATPKRSS